MRKFSPDGGANQDQPHAKRVRADQSEGATNRLHRPPRFDRPQRGAKRHKWSSSDEEGDDDLELPEGV
eukprot:COSAG02_NODE_13816_length_1344_cov_1.117269_2_plen_68_part_00